MREVLRIPQAGGCWLSEKMSDLAAHPFAQLGFVILCVSGSASTS